MPLRGCSRGHTEPAAHTRSRGPEAPGIPDGRAWAQKRGALRRPGNCGEREGVQLFTSATLEAVMTFLPSFSLTAPVTVICFTPLHTLPWNFWATSFFAIR